MVIHKHSFELQSDLSELKSLSHHLNNFSQATGLSEEFVSRINICLDELFTNVVLYGFSDDLEQVVKFEMKIEGNVLKMTIEDKGIPFNPLEKECSELHKDLGKVKVGGLGIQIVKKLMDDISYERKLGKNKLTLKKFIRTSSYIYQNDLVKKESFNYHARN